MRASSARLAVALHLTTSYSLPTHFLLTASYFLPYFLLPTSNVLLLTLLSRSTKLLERREIVSRF